MKKILLALVLLGMNEALIAAGPVLPEWPAMDTVVIKFGNNARILILVDNPQELKKISEFDVNAMLRDLSISVDSLEGDQRYLRIEDNSGKKYLKDTALVVNRSSNPEPEGLKTSDREALKKEMEENMNFNDRERKKKYRRGTSDYFNLELGMNNYLTEDRSFPDESNALYTVKPWGSWYTAINNNFRTHLFGILYLDWGAGISWYNFKFQNSSARIEKDAEQVNFYEDQTVENPVKSKLTVTYLNVNFVPVLSFGSSGRKKDIFHWDYPENGFRIGLGAYAGYRIDSYSKAVWKDSGKKEKDHDKSNYFLNNFRYGTKVILGFKSVDLFINYDLNDLFAEGAGPKLNAFSFGIIL